LGTAGGSLSTGGETVTCAEELNTILCLSGLIASGAMPVSGSIASILAYSFVFGLKHAVEPDHLAAVSSIVSERKSLLGSMIVGGWWGCGHTLSLLIAGLVVTLLGIDLGEEHLRPLDLLVAAMLIALGLNALWKLADERRQTNEIETRIAEIATHRGHTCDFPRESAAHRCIGLRPLIVGMIHGLAGSAALLLLLIPIIPSVWLKLAYLLVFGAGSIVGMMLMSWLVGLPAHLTAARFARIHFAVRALAGSAGVLFGLLLLYEFVAG
jgi:high-affinity nickel permease